MQLTNCINEISNKYQIDFNNKLPFLKFGDDKESNNDILNSFSKYYEEILNLMGYDIKLNTIDMNEGYFMLNTLNNYSIRLRVWDNFKAVEKNILLLIENI